VNPFVDTNWLEALYIEPSPNDKAARARAAVAERRTRKEDAIITSHIVLLEARNIFSRVTGHAHPSEWDDLIADFGGRIFVDPMDWDLLRRETNQLFGKFSHLGSIGTFDAAIVASAQLAGAREILSFDERLKALATAIGIRAFPPLGSEGRGFLGSLKDKGP
jgi:predicted nucleic acid-binding protein